MLQIRRHGLCCQHLLLGSDRLIDDEGPVCACCRRHGHDFTGCQDADITYVLWPYNRKHVKSVFKKARDQAQELAKVPGVDTEMTEEATGVDALVENLGDVDGEDSDSAEEESGAAVYRAKKPRT
ncbi:hypothetical protein ACMFMG_010528 [Clarireedia jacksonii]